MRKALLLTHGAGSNADSPVLRRVAVFFETAGFLTVRFNLAYRQLRPDGPPRRGVDVADRESIATAAAELRQQVDGELWIGGHSYGGRQASMLAAENASVADRLLLLSYPLHPPRKPEQLRVGHFPQLRTPVTFVHGTRDPFGSIAELEAAIAAIPAQKQLLVLKGAGHELGKPTLETVLQQCLETR
jgi:predicted alpha/beta-hydrolase family hydrolase